MNQFSLENGVFVAIEMICWKMLMLMTSLKEKKVKKKVLLLSFDAAAETFCFNKEASFSLTR